MSRAAAEPPVPGSSLVLVGGRPAAVVAFETDVVGFFVDAADLLGVPKSVAAIYGMVFASPVPLGFAEIDARLDIARGSVSQGLRALREVGAIKEAGNGEPGARSYEVDLEMRKLIGRFLENRLNTQLKSGGERLGGLQGRLAALSASDQKQLAPRLQKLRRWHDRTRKLLPVIRTFLQIA